MRHSDRIQKYLDGNMMEDELKKFRDDLQKDPELAQELDLHRSIGEIIVSGDEERFRRKLNEAYKSYNLNHLVKVKEARVFRKSSIFSYAAIGLPVLLIFLVTLYFIEFRVESNQAIFEKNLGSYSKDLVFRKQFINEAESSILEQGIQLFNQGSYSEASGLFSRLLSEKSENIDAQFYNGLCYIFLNEFNSAITAFDFVVNQPYNYYQEYAKWYMALCYIRINNSENAKLLLREIIDENSYFSPKAKKILKKLR